MHKDLAAFVADLERRDTQWHELAEYYFEASLKLESHERAGKMLGEAVGEGLALLRAVQKDLLDRAKYDPVDGKTRVVGLSNTLWLRLCAAVGEDSNE